MKGLIPVDQRFLRHKIRERVVARIFFKENGCDLVQPRRLSVSSKNAGWSSLVARQAHNLKVAGSNPAPATSSEVVLGVYGCCLSSWKARCYLLRFALFVFDGLSVRPRRRFGLLATKFDYLPGFLDNFCPRICPSFGQFQVGFKADDVV